MEKSKHDFRIRTVTAFVHLRKESVEVDWKDSLKRAAKVCRTAQQVALSRGIEVQTLRIATNAYKEYVSEKHWLEEIQVRVKCLYPRDKCWKHEALTDRRIEHESPWSYSHVSWISTSSR